MRNCPLNKTRENEKNMNNILELIKQIMHSLVMELVKLLDTDILILLLYLFTLYFIFVWSVLYNALKCHKTTPLFPALPQSLKAIWHEVTAIQILFQ